MSFLVQIILSLRNSGEFECVDFLLFIHSFIYFKIIIPVAKLGFNELHNQLKHLRKIPDIVNTGDTYYSLTK